MARTTKRSTRTKPTTRTTRAIRVSRATAAEFAKVATVRAQQARKLALAGTRQVRNALVAGVVEARTRAADTVARLERVFEDRVTRVIGRLGVPTARDVRALSRQVAHLQQSVDGLRRARVRA